MRSSSKLPAQLISVELVLAILRRPDLWPAALRSAQDHAPKNWWRRRPFVPLPDPAWISFRLETAYGRDQDQPVGAKEFVTWLEWQATKPI